MAFQGIAYNAITNEWTFDVNAIIFAGALPNSILEADGNRNMTSTQLNNGQLLIGRTGLLPLAAQISGDTNGIVVTSSSGSIVVSLSTSATPTLAGLTLNGPFIGQSINCSSIINSGTSSLQGNVTCGGSISTGGSVDYLGTQSAGTYQLSIAGSQLTTNVVVGIGSSGVVTGAARLFVGGRGTTSKFVLGSANGGTSTNISAATNDSDQITIPAVTSSSHVDSYVLAGQSNTFTGSNTFSGEINFSALSASSILSLDSNNNVVATNVLGGNSFTSLTVTGTSSFGDTITCNAINSGSISAGSNSIVTTGPISCNAITNNGPYSGGTNTISGGSINCSSLSNSGTTSLGGNTTCQAINAGTYACTVGALACGAITSSGTISNGTSSMTCGSLFSSAITNSGSMSAGGTTITGTLSCTSACTTGALSSSSINFGGSTLSVYQTGTWTPALASSGGGSATYSSQGGNYTKIGRIVFCDFFLETKSVTGLTTGNLSLTGLPYTVTGGNPAVCWAAGLPSTGGGNATNFQIIIAPTASGTTAAINYTTTSSSYINLAVVNLSANSIIAGQFQFYV